MFKILYWVAHLGAMGLVYFGLLDPYNAISLARQGLEIVDEL